MSKRYFTEKQYKELLKHIVILVDTREQSNKKILEYFDKHNIKYKQRALNTGDYSFMVEACEELHMYTDLWYVDELCIERKNSIDELAGNLLEKDERFLKELNRMKNIKQNYILIENNSLKDIIHHNYQSKYNELAYIRTILKWQKQVNFYLNFANTDDMGFLIYEICKSCLDSKILK